MISLKFKRIEKIWRDKNSGRSRGNFDKVIKKMILLYMYLHINPYPTRRAPPRTAPAARTAGHKYQCMIKY